MLRFNDIADRALEYDPDCDLALLQRAYVYTAKVHDGQVRHSGSPISSIPWRSPESWWRCSSMT